MAREILNAIFYILSNGCAWRLLPHDLPPWPTVYYYFRCWRIAGLTAAYEPNFTAKSTLFTRARDNSSERAIVDSQSVKTTEVAQEVGYDGKSDLVITMDLSYMRSHPQTPDENIQIRVGEHICRLAFTRHGDEADPYPLYDLDIFIDGLVMYEVFTEDQVVDEIPTDGLVASKSKATSWGTAQLLKLVRGVFDALDEWCLRHPRSYLTTFNWQLYQLYSTLRRKGYACDGRMDTWITHINQEGQRVLLPGMLNLIEDKLAINDLWRVAKDTDYYLGRPFTPVDVFKQILGEDPQ